MDALDNPQTSFSMGGQMRIILEVEGLSEHRDSLVGVVFKSSGDQRIMSINTGMTCAHVQHPRTKQELAVLTVPRLPLTPGSYQIDTAVAQQGIAMLDYVEHAGHFNVTEADVYGTGYRVSSYFGQIYLEGDWKIRSQS
jgi:hypothetical protein